MPARLVLVLVLSFLPGLASGKGSLSGQRILDQIGRAGFASKRLSPEPLARSFRPVNAEALFRRTGSADSTYASVFEYQESLGTLRKRFATIGRSDRLDTTSTVLYPFAGSDAAFPVRMFPNATLTIAIDSHVFATRRQAGFAYRAPADHMGYRNYLDIGESRSQGSQVLSNLAVSVPGFRLRALHLFGPKRAPQGSALIEYDGGQGTPVRHFLYLNERISRRGRLADQWWSSLLPKQGLALAVKGSMYFKYTALHDDLAERLTRTPRSVAVGASDELSFSEVKGVWHRVKVRDVLMGYDRGFSSNNRGYTQFILSGPKER